MAMMDTEALVKLGPTIPPMNMMPLSLGRGFRLDQHDIVEWSDPDLAPGVMRHKGRKETGKWVNPVNNADIQYQKQEDFKQSLHGGKEQSRTEVIKGQAPDTEFQIVRSQSNFTDQNEGGSRVHTTSSTSSYQMRGMRSTVIKSSTRSNQTTTTTSTTNNNRRIGEPEFENLGLSFQPLDSSSQRERINMSRSGTMGVRRPPTRKPTGSIPPVIPMISPFHHHPYDDDDDCVGEEDHFGNEGEEESEMEVEVKVDSSEDSAEEDRQFLEFYAPPTHHPTHTPEDTVKERLRGVPMIGFPVDVQLELQSRLMKNNKGGGGDFNENQFNIFNKQQDDDVGLLSHSTPSINREKGLGGFGNTRMLNNHHSNHTPFWKEFSTKRALLLEGEEEEEEGGLNQEIIMKPKLWNSWKTEDDWNHRSRIQPLFDSNNSSDDNHTPKNQNKVTDIPIILNNNNDNEGEGFHHFSKNQDYHNNNEGYFPESSPEPTPTEFPFTLERSRRLLEMLNFEDDQTGTGSRTGNTTRSDKEEEEEDDQEESLDFLNTSFSRVLNNRMSVEDPSSEDPNNNNRKSTLISHTWISSSDLPRPSQKAWDNDVTTTISTTHNQLKKSLRKVEFCKTEVHFTPDSGKFKIVETDENKPTTSHLFRRKKKDRAKLCLEQGEGNTFEPKPHPQGGSLGTPEDPPLEEEIIISPQQPPESLSTPRNYEEMKIQRYLEQLKSPNLTLTSGSTHNNNNPPPSRSLYENGSFVPLATRRSLIEMNLNNTNTANTTSKETSPDPSTSRRPLQARMKATVSTSTKPKPKITSVELKYGFDEDNSQGEEVTPTFDKGVEGEPTLSSGKPKFTPSISPRISNLINRCYYRNPVLDNWPIPPRSLKEPKQDLPMSVIVSQSRSTHGEGGNSRSIVTIGNLNSSPPPLAPQFEFQPRPSPEPMLSLNDHVWRGPAAAAPSSYDYNELFNNSPASLDTAARSMSVSISQPDVEPEWVIKARNRTTVDWDKVGVGRQGQDQEELSRLSSGGGMRPLQPPWAADVINTKTKNKSLSFNQDQELLSRASLVYPWHAPHNSIINEGDTTGDDDGTYTSLKLPPSLPEETTPTPPNKNTKPKTSKSPPVKPPPPNPPGTGSRLKSKSTKESSPPKGVLRTTKPTKPPTSPLKKTPGNLPSPSSISSSQTQRSTPTVHRHPLVKVSKLPVKTNPPPLPSPSSQGSNSRSGRSNPNNSNTDVKRKHPPPPPSATAKGPLRTPPEKKKKNVNLNLTNKKMKECPPAKPAK